MKMFSEYFAQTKAIKVFARLFQKAARSRARSPRRSSQRAKSFYGVSFLQSFFLCASGVKEKSVIALRYNEKSVID